MANFDALLRDYQWATERLAVGSAVTTPEQVQALVRDGITHVMDCRIGKPELQLYRRSTIEYLHNPTADDIKPKPNEWFFKGFEFYERATKVAHAKVLVHCRFGMSRGPKMTYAILRMVGIEPEAAKRRVCDARPVAKVAYVADADRAALAWKNGQR